MSEFSQKRRELVLTFDLLTHLINALPLGFFIFVFSIRKLLLGNAIERMNKEAIALKKQGTLSTRVLEFAYNFGHRVHINEYVSFFAELLLIGGVNVLAIFALAQYSLGPDVLYFIILTVIVAFGFVVTFIEHDRYTRVSLWSSFALFASILVYSLFLGSGFLSSTGLGDTVTSIFPATLAFVVVWLVSYRLDFGLPVPAIFEER